MTSVPELAAALQALKSAELEELARESRFIQREGKFRAASFVQTVVLGWLRNPDNSLSGLSSWSYRVGKG